MYYLIKMFDSNSNLGSNIKVLLRSFRQFLLLCHCDEAWDKCVMPGQAAEGCWCYTTMAKTFQETLRLPEACRAVLRGWYCISGKWWLWARPAVSLSDQERGFSSQSHSCPLQTHTSLLESLSYRLVVALSFHLIVILLWQRQMSWSWKTGSQQIHQM